MFSSIICSPFVEHPVTDIAQLEPNEFDVVAYSEEQTSSFLNKGNFNKELYCKCLLYKIFSLTKSKIKPFIQYQCDNMQKPIVWLNKLEKLIDLNRDLFTTKEHIIKFEKTLTLIEIMREAIENQSKLPKNHFDINHVKSKLKEYTIFEDKLSYLCEMETDYKQQRPVIYNSNAVPFDEQISLEIEKLTKQELLKEKSKQRSEILSNSSKPSAPKNQVSIQLNCNLNYFVDIFYQLSLEKQAISGSLKEIAEYISRGLIDKEGNPVSADSVYSMLKPSNFEKRPKGPSRFKLE
jgi:hypothetical protein